MTVTRSRAPLALLVLVAPLLAATIGCSNDFVPYESLAALRVLAVRSEPASPAAGESATLTALVYTPAPPADPPPSYAWTWCPFPGDANAGYPCTLSAEDLAARVPALAGALPPTVLGDTPAVAFSHGLSPEIVAAVCAGTVPGLPTAPDCDVGLPVQIQLAVTTATDRIDTVWTLLLPANPGAPPNANPIVDGLSAEVAGQETALGDDGAVALPRGTETVIRAEVMEASAERYAGTDDSGQLASVRERLFLSWFVEDGDSLRDARTGFIEGKTALADALENRWTPAPAPPLGGGRDTARLLVVVRDNRGGVAWRQARVALVTP